MTESGKTPRPRDANKLARFIVDVATEEAADRILTVDGRDAAAVALGRLGGLKGGRARADKMPPEMRTEIAKRAAIARWAKK